jgi:hypothetical protein
MDVAPSKVYVATLAAMTAGLLIFLTVAAAAKGL